MLVAGCIGKFSRPHLCADLFLVFSREVDKVIVFCANQERDCRLVETATLAIPLLDAVQGALSCEVEHEEDGDCVIADERQHVDKFALASEIPY